MKIELNTEWLQKNSSMIHYFGLGFIQIKLDDFNRVHFYTGKLPRTVKVEEIHDHRYNFVSKILKGMLFQEIYEVQENELGTHSLVQETCQPGEKEFALESKSCLIIPVFNNDYYEGDSYYIDHNTFHTVLSSYAITHVKRGGYKKELANVAYPKDCAPVCPFSVKIEETQLWEIVDEIINYPGAANI